VLTNENFQASLAESFLADLDELSDNEPCQVSQIYIFIVERKYVVQRHLFLTDICVLTIFQEEVNAEAVNMEEDVDGNISDLIKSVYCDDLDSISKLQKTQYYNDIMQVRDMTFTPQLVALYKTAVEYIF
jgi:U4/U6 small nuclear ribonucleoprotein PRP31